MIAVVQLKKMNVVSVMERVLEKVTAIASAIKMIVMEIVEVVLN